LTDGASLKSIPLVNAIVDSPFSYLFYQAEVLQPYDLPFIFQGHTVFFEGSRYPCRIGIQQVYYEAPSDQSLTSTCKMPYRVSDDGRINVGSKIFQPGTHNNNAIINDISISGILHTSPLEYGYIPIPSGYGSVCHQGINFSSTKGLISVPEVTIQDRTVNIGTFAFVSDGQTYEGGGSYTIEPYMNIYGEVIGFYDVLVWISGSQLQFYQFFGIDNTLDYDANFTGLNRSLPYQKVHPSNFYVGYVRGIPSYNPMPITSGLIPTVDETIVYSYNTPHPLDAKPSWHLIPTYYCGDSFNSTIGRFYFTYMYNEEDDFNLIVVAPGIPSGVAGFSNMSYSSQYSHFIVNGEAFHKPYEELTLPNESGDYYVGYDRMGMLIYNNQPMELVLGKINRSEPILAHWMQAFDTQYQPTTIHLDGVGFLNLEDSILEYSDGTISLKPKNKYGGFDLAWHSLPDYIHTNSNITYNLTSSSGDGFYYYIKNTQYKGKYYLSVSEYDDLWDYEIEGRNGKILIAHTDGGVMYDDRMWTSFDSILPNGSSGIITLGREFYYGYKDRIATIIPKDNIYYVNGYNVTKIQPNSFEIPWAVTLGYTDTGANRGGMGTIGRWQDDQKYNSQVQYPYIYVNDDGVISLGFDKLFINLNNGQFPFGLNSHNGVMRGSGIQSNTLCIPIFRETVSSTNMKTFLYYNSVIYNGHSAHFLVIPDGSKSVFPDLNQVQGLRFENLILTTSNQ